MLAVSALRATALLAVIQLSVPMKISLGSLAPPAASVGPQHFDLVVLGGGSGGLAASKAAAQLGKKVAVCNFVKPSPAGTTWGLGGTCVNVGCIPKKLMHEAAQLGGARTASAWFGWDPAEEDHEWKVLTKNVQNLVKSMNFAYRTQCSTNDVALFNAFATFVDPHTVEATQQDGSKVTLTADHFILATGGRPRYPSVPGALEHCITSDDVFSLEAPPGKTLVVGASYVALECAGFLRGLGFEVTVLMRSVPLRGFDQQMAAHIVEDLEGEGVVFVRGAELVRVDELEHGRKAASWTSTAEAAESSDAFDTVLLAVGRDAYTQKLGLDKAGVTRNAANGKLPVRREQTNVEHIYAIGDIIDGEALEPPSHLTELTPVAIQAGRLLAHRLYGAPGGREMDYRTVPTTVFTPLEYGCVGYTEEDAIAEFGAENLEVFHQYYQPLEWRIVKSRSDRSGFVKLIVHKADAGRVIGLHVCGPHAGEMTQGFAVAIRCGATKADFDETVGIHPTSAEIFTTMDVTKRSGISPNAKAC